MVIKPIKPKKYMCPNCKTHLSCGCLKRTASDGTQVCTSCITQYESALAIIKQNTNTQTPKQ